MILNHFLSQNKGFLTTYIYQKLKLGHFHCLLKTLKYIYILQNFGHVQIKSIIYRQNIYNL